MRPVVTLSWRVEGRPGEGSVWAGVGGGVGPAGEALVMPEVEVGLGAVVGDEHLAVLSRAHRPGIDVEVGVELAQADLEAARLEERPERRRGQALAKRGDHAAGDEDVPRHGPRSIKEGVRPRKRARPVASRPSTEERTFAKK